MGVSILQKYEFMNNVIVRKASSSQAMTANSDIA